MKTIVPRPVKDQSVIIPGSKSISHRMMICASLSHNTSMIDNLLLSEDIRLTMEALKNMGSNIQKKQDNKFLITGFGGFPKPAEKEIYLGNSGTSMRLLAGIAALGNTRYTLTGDKRMCERPMVELLDALNMIGIHAESITQNGTPPVYITGKSREGGFVKLDCTRSSQYLSSLLMMGAILENGLDIELLGTPVSSPYIDLTLDIMKKFDVNACQDGSMHYKVPGKQRYQNQNLVVEPDLSNAGYFWAIGAITKKMIRVQNINKFSLQGDLKQIDILEQMGCRIEHKSGQIGVCGYDLKGIEIDMSDTPDAVPAIAIVASFAKGDTKITNIHHLREKECDRIEAISSQLIKMGVKIEQGDDYIIVTGGHPRGARIETFNDHRIAMAFSIPGLMIEGMEIMNETCVKKSFPNYWELFDAI